MWEYPAVRLREIVPQGGPRRSTTFVALGDGFEAGAQIFLVRHGGQLSRPDDVIETRDICVASQNQLKFIGDLTGNEPGPYDAYLLLPSRGKSTLLERSSMLARAYVLKAVPETVWSERAIGRIRPEVPEALVDDAAWSRIRQAAKAGPEITVGDLTLECHLTPETPRVDLILRLLPADRDAYLDALELDHEENPTLTFLRRWADQSQNFAHVPWVDLESDLDSDSAHEPFLGPGIEAYYDRSAEDLLELRRDPAAPMPVANPAVARAVLSAYHQALSGEILERVGTVIDALPSDGFITGVGSLGCRWSSPSSAARLIVSLPRSSVRPFFDHPSVGWPISRDTMAMLLGTTRNRVSLDIDVNAQGLGPRVARYYTFPTPSLSHPFLAETLKLIERHELARPSRLEALRAWIERDRSTKDRAARVLTIKLVANDSRVQECKAYLSFTLDPTDA